MMGKSKKIMIMLITLCVLCCEFTTSKVNTEEVEKHIQRENVATKEVCYDVNMPVASGTTVYQNDTAIIDASNAADGYVMVKYNGTNKKVKFCVDTPSGQRYSYLLKDYEEYTVLPLTEGNGSYTVSVLESYNIENFTYTIALSKALDVNIQNPNSPFLFPNIYVDYSETSDVVEKARELAEDCYTDYDVVANVYDYIINKIVYDDEEAETVKSGYAPDPDEVLNTGKGICFDYASLMTAMLRSQNIPTRLHVGYAGEVYHAWVSCYVNGEWVTFDPTIGANNSKASVKRFVDGDNYKTKYVY